MSNEDVIARSDALDERIAGTETIQHLERTGRRNRMFIALLALSMGLDIVLTIAVGVLAFRTQQVVHDQQAVAAQARATCVAANQTREGQLQLWHHILDLPPTAPRTPEQQAQADAFGHYVDGLFAPRRC